MEAGRVGGRGDEWIGGGQGGDLATRAGREGALTKKG